MYILSKDPDLQNIRHHLVIQCWTKPWGYRPAESRILEDPKIIHLYWVPQKLPQIYTVIAYICIVKVA